MLVAGTAKRLRLSPETDQETVMLEAIIENERKRLGRLTSKGRTDDAGTTLLCYFTHDDEEWGTAFIVAPVPY